LLAVSSECSSAISSTLRVSSEAFFTKLAMRASRVSSARRCLSSSCSAARSAASAARVSFSAAVGRGLAGSPPLRSRDARSARSDSARARASVARACRSRSSAAVSPGVFFLRSGDMSFACIAAPAGARIAPQSRFAPHTAGGADEDGAARASANGASIEKIDASSSSLSAHDPNELADAPEAASLPLNEPSDSTDATRLSVRFRVSSAAEPRVPPGSFFSVAALDARALAAGRGGLEARSGFEPGVNARVFARSAIRPHSCDVCPRTVRTVCSSESFFSISSSVFERRRSRRRDPLASRSRRRSPRFPRAGRQPPAAASLSASTTARIMSRLASLGRAATRPTSHEMLVFC